MINLEQAKRYCPDNYKEIKNYEQAMKDSTQVWECHHINGEWWSREWLKANNLYYNRTDPHEFIFLTEKEHTSLHKKGTKHTQATKDKISNSNKGKNKGKSPWCKDKPFSYFGKKFKEHYGLSRHDNEKLYKREHEYYRRNKRLSWEVNNEVC